jgi:HK97 gp10 family phage protein
MPYYIKTEGMDELIQKLEKAGDRALGVGARALYKGAGVVADAISSGARSIATEPFKYAGGGTKRKPSPEEKAILNAAGAAGIAKFDKNGLSVNTAVGYNRSGYAQVNWNHMSNKARTKYKIKGGGNAKPVAVIANAINSGTSFMEKQPFIRKAITKSKGAAQSAMEATIEQLVDQILD